MLTDTPPASANQEAAAKARHRARGGYARIRRHGMLEALAVVVMLAAAAAVRLALAARGWPGVNSDESIMGLMTDDVLWHGAHPVFFYGQHYMGALQSYEAIPVFLALGATDFALRATTTLQFILFLAALYGFARAIYSPLVALGTLALLVFGSQDMLFGDVHAGIGAQDTWLFGTLLLWFVVLRLRRPQHRITKLALNVGIGLAAGLGLWADFLIVPYLCAAGLALLVEARRWARRRSPQQSRRSLMGQALLVVAPAGIVLVPFLIETVTSRGATFIEVLAAAGAAGAADGSGHLHVLNTLLSIPKQMADVLLVSLPHVLGSGQVCRGCVVWPAPSGSVALADVLRLVLLSLPFSLAALACGLVAAIPLARDVRQARRQAKGKSTPLLPSINGSDVAPFDPRWWGRAMLVIGGGLTILAFALSNSSYQYALSSSRYLTGIYLCAPLFAAPLVRSSAQVWRWLRAQMRRSSVLPRPGLLAFLASGLLLAALAVNVSGSEAILRQAYTASIPTGDAQTLAFLEAHGATRFYTSYWACYRLAFESQEQISCALITGKSIFDTDGGRIPAYLTQVAAAPHPAYVFDTATTDYDPGWPRQVSQEIASGNPQFADYQTARIATFIIFYYAGP